MAIRLQAQTNSAHLFLKMGNGKCQNKNVGINTIGALPKIIGIFLHLSDAALYTGNSFRRTSVTSLVDGGGDITSVKRHTGHKSDAVKEGYMADSI